MAFKEKYNKTEIDDMAEFLEEFTGYYLKNRPAIVSACEIALGWERPAHPKRTKKKIPITREEFEQVIVHIDSSKTAKPELSAQQQLLTRLDDLAVLLVGMKKHFSTARDAVDNRLTGEAMKDFNEEVQQGITLRRFQNEFSEDTFVRINKLFHDLEYELQTKCSEKQKQLDEYPDAKENRLVRDQLQATLNHLEPALEALQTLHMQLQRNENAFKIEYKQNAAGELLDMLEIYAKELPPAGAVHQQPGAKLQGVDVRKSRPDRTPGPHS